MSPLEFGRNRNQTYIIFSVDTEHDIISRFNTRTDGWSKGIPLLFETFDSVGMRGKVCWLIEYNLKEGVVASNLSSDFYVKEFPELITQIKNRRDEIGVHPTMYNWVGGKQPISVTTYNDPNSWDFNKPTRDSEFVTGLITAAVKELKAATGVNPVGCRTGNFHYATHLASALERNGIGVDSSTAKRQAYFVKPPNIYYADRNDIRDKSILKTGVLEIPTINCMDYNLANPLSRIKTEYLLHLKQPIFLSFYIHNWEAITSDGGKNEYYLGNLASFLRLFRNRGACFISWIDAKQMFESLYETKEFQEQKL